MNKEEIARSAHAAAMNAAHAHPPADARAVNLVDAAGAAVLERLHELNVLVVDGLTLEEEDLLASIDEKIDKLLELRKTAQEPQPKPLVDVDALEEVFIIFDGPPAHESGRFVETETPDGRGIRFGEWRELEVDPNGPDAGPRWALVVPGPKQIRDAFDVDEFRERVRGEVAIACDEVEQGTVRRGGSARGTHVAVPVSASTRAAIVDAVERRVVRALGIVRSGV